MQALLTSFIDENLDIYKHELLKLRWPVFVYSYLNMVKDYDDKATQFFDEFKTNFEHDRDHDLRELSLVKNPNHIDESDTARVYWTNKYRVTMVESTHFTLLSFLESRDRSGGTVVITIMSTHMNILTVNRVSAADRSFGAMLARQGAHPTLPEEDEGIPGHNPGSANTDLNAPSVLTRVLLGRMPMDDERAEDVRGELEDIDIAEPPGPGETSLVEEFEQKIKRENSEDGPGHVVPYPKAAARDIITDVEKVRAYRDRFKLVARSNGVGPGISVCMFTLHNTLDTVTCIDFSGDNEMIAAGFEDHYIKLWSVNGDALPSADPAEEPRSSRKLIGHSGPVYAVSFSPSMARSPDAPRPANEDDDDDANAAAEPSLRPQTLISASADRTIRLWELTTYTNLVVYKGHNAPIWDARFSPLGHYFASGGGDRTARLWATSSSGPLRIFAGHDADVENVAWHPNGSYIFTAAGDRSTRMWDVASGRAVRIFSGHAGVPTTLSCSPSGRLLASADDAGVIVVWNLESGRRVRVLRGHARGGIWGVDWSVESTVLVSCGADATVRSWDIALSNPGGAASGASDGMPSSAGASSSAKNDGKTAGSAAGANGNDAGKGSGANGANGSTTTTTTTAAGAGGAAGKVGGRNAGPGGAGSGVSPEQISCFPTKKSPVYAVRFTDMNLVLAAGAFLP